jgi:hypothetical protein
VRRRSGALVDIASDIQREIHPTVALLDIIRGQAENSVESEDENSHKWYEDLPGGSYPWTETWYDGHVHPVDAILLAIIDQLEDAVRDLCRAIVEDREARRAPGGGS